MKPGQQVTFNVPVMTPYLHATLGLKAGQHAGRFVRYGHWLGDQESCIVMVGSLEVYVAEKDWQVQLVKPTPCVAIQTAAVVGLFDFPAPTPDPTEAQAAPTAAEVLLMVADANESWQERIRQDRLYAARQADPDYDRVVTRDREATYAVRQLDPAHLRALAAPTPQPVPEPDQVGELLAIMHSDGGHHQAQHGTQQAARDALEKYIALVTRLDAVEYALKLATQPQPAPDALRGRCGGCEHWVGPLRGRQGQDMKECAKLTMSDRNTVEEPEQIMSSLPGGQYKPILFDERFGCILWQARPALAQAAE